MMKEKKEAIKVVKKGDRMLFMGDWCECMENDGGMLRFKFEKGGGEFYLRWKSYVRGLNLSGVVWEYVEEGEEPSGVIKFKEDEKSITKEEFEKMKKVMDETPVFIQDSLVDQVYEERIKGILEAVNDMSERHGVVVRFGWGINVEVKSVFGRVVLEDLDGLFVWIEHYIDRGIFDEGKVYEVVVEMMYDENEDEEGAEFVFVKYKEEGESDLMWRVLLEN